MAEESVEQGLLSELYVAHAPDGIRLALLLTGDRALAEDLVQHAFAVSSVAFATSATERSSFGTQHFIRTGSSPPTVASARSAREPDQDPEVPTHPSAAGSVWECRATWLHRRSRRCHRP